MNMNGIPILIN